MPQVPATRSANATANPAHACQLERSQNRKVARPVQAARRSVGVCLQVTTGDDTGDGAQMRLATYGTLAPGRQNHDQLGDLPGRWLTGYVHGSLVQEGWGAELGSPALIPNPDGPRIDVFVFES